MCAIDDDKFSDELLRMMEAESHFNLDLSDNEFMFGGCESESEDENDKDQDGEDEEPPKKTSEFDWSTERFEPLVLPYQESPYEIDPVLSCPDTREIDFFMHFFDPDICLQVVDSINQTYIDFIEDEESSAHLKKWHNVTVPEFYIFITVCMLMTRNKRCKMEEHWSTDHLLYSPIFGTMMGRSRFSALLYLLRKPTPTTPADNIIDTLIHHARHKFKTVVKNPTMSVSVNETIIPFKGLMTRHDQKKTGVKLFTLRDLKTNIIHDFTLYFGPEKVDQYIMSGLKATETAIVNLLKDYFNTFRHLYVDERYTSPRLFKYLYDNNIYACGKTSQKKTWMPNFNKNLKPGEISVGYCNPLTAIQWHHKHYTYFLTTIHSDAMTQLTKKDKLTGELITKPAASIAFTKNMNMNYADNSDLMMSSNRSLCPLNWHKKLLFHIIDMHMLNAFNCYRVSKEINGRTTFASFQLRVMRQLIETYHSSTKSVDRSIKRNVNNPINTLPVTAAQHMPTKAEKYQRCKLCSKQKKRKDTKFTCTICQVYLCACPCFQVFHQQQNLDAVAESAE